PLGAQDKRHRVGSSGGNHALVDKSFRLALVGDVIVPVSNQHGDSRVVVADIPILETDVEVEFLQTLIGSCVGRMREGVEIKKLQMKLGLAGLQAVKVLD
ncbi:hypothetical protein A2U01_0072548, partial [Trifolium medium]|nr:hypothetical protein [Trifolium medium]